MRRHLVSPYSAGLVGWGPVINNCKAALLPVQNLSDGTLSWDVSRWSPIQQTGLAINHYCVEALGMRGVVGTGGIDPVGEASTALMIRSLTHSMASKVIATNFVSYFTRQNLNSIMTHSMITIMAAPLQFGRVTESLRDHRLPKTMTQMFQDHHSVLKPDRVEEWVL